MQHVIRHATLEANGARLHYARTGSGPPLVLLHGWPEFWLTWEPVMARLADRFDLIAPDLRGFGDSPKPDEGPSDRAGPEVHAADLLALLDHLGLARVGLVSHDVGAYVAQAFARAHPERLTRLFFFDCPYPGIGARWAEPLHLKEIWYQSFHQKPWAAALVGSSREACRIYFGNHAPPLGGRKPGCLRRRGARGLGRQLPEARQPAGRLRLVHQRQRRPSRRDAGRGAAPAADRRPGRGALGRPRSGAEGRVDRPPGRVPSPTSTPLRSTVLGHFPHREDPDRAAAEITACFGGGPA